VKRWMMLVMEKKWQVLKEAVVGLRLNESVALRREISGAPRQPVSWTESWEETNSSREASRLLTSDIVFNDCKRLDWRSSTCTDLVDSVVLSTVTAAPNS